MRLKTAGDKSASMAKRIAHRRVGARRQRAKKSLPYLLTEGGPNLFDVRLPVSEIRFAINGPGMLFEKLQLLTSLDASDGATPEAYQELAAALSGVAHCGHRAPEKVPIDVRLSRIGARLEIGFGPMGMYQSELVLRTKSGKSFQQVLDDALLNGKKRIIYQAVLSPIPGTGHHEVRDTDPANDQDRPAAEHDHTQHGMHQ